MLKRIKTKTQLFYILITSGALFLGCKPSDGPIYPKTTDCRTNISLNMTNLPMSVQPIYAPGTLWEDGDQDISISHEDICYENSYTKFSYKVGLKGWAGANWLINNDYNDSITIPTGITKFSFSARATSGSSFSVSCLNGTGWPGGTVNITANGNWNDYELSFSPTTKSNITSIMSYTIGKGSVSFGDTVTVEIKDIILE